MVQKALFLSAYTITRDSKRLRQMYAVQHFPLKPIPTESFQTALL